jgi:hypothetical protein
VVALFYTYWCRPDMQMDPQVTDPLIETLGEGKQFM